MQRDIADYRIGLRGCNLYLLRVARHSRRDYLDWTDYSDSLNSEQDKKPLVRSC